VLFQLEKVVRKMSLEKTAKQLVTLGVHDQEKLFKLLQDRYPAIHYSLIREAVHNAKQR
jgi:hypothetical protein